MKVCLLNDSFPPQIDGVANVVTNYARHLTAAGNSVCVATPAYPDVVDDYPYDVVRYPSFDTTKFIGYRAGYPFAPEALEKLGSFGADIYHSHCPVASNILARTLRESAPAPLIFTYHTKFDIDIANAVKGQLLQQAAINVLVKNIDACDEIWVVSEGAGKNLQSLGYEGDYRIMRNGVDFPKGAPPDEECRAIRERHGIAADEPMLLFVGRLMWYKGLRTVLDALQALKEADVPFKMVFVGSSMEEEEIRAYAETLRLSDRCIFTGAVKDREELRRYFGAADLFMFLSDFDTNGIVVREAAACGCAAMLLRNSAAAEGIVHGQNGFLTERGTASVSALLTKLCLQPQLMRAVGQNAMNELYYSWQDAVACANERYLQVADDYRSGRLQLKRRPMDTVFDAAADINDALERAHNLRERRKAEFSRLFLQPLPPDTSPALPQSFELGL